MNYSEINWVFLHQSVNPDGSDADRTPMTSRTVASSVPGGVLVGSWCRGEVVSVAFVPGAKIDRVRGESSYHPDRWYLVAAEVSQ